MKLLDYLSIFLVIFIPLFSLFTRTDFFFFHLYYTYLYSCNNMLYFKWEVLVSFNKICVIISFHFLLTFTCTKQSNNYLTFYLLSIHFHSLNNLSYYFLWSSKQTLSVNHAVLLNPLTWPVVPPLTLIAHKRERKARTNNAIGIHELWNLPGRHV